MDPKCGTGYRTSSAKPDSDELNGPFSSGFLKDKSTGLVEALGDFFPEAKWQRCVVHWYRNAFAKCPKRKTGLVAAMLKAIHAQEDKDAARQKAALVAEKLRRMKLDSVAEFVEK